MVPVLWLVVVVLNNKVPLHKQLKSFPLCHSHRQTSSAQPQHAALDCYGHPSIYSYSMHKILIPNLSILENDILPNLR